MGYMGKQGDTPEGPGTLHWLGGDLSFPGLDFLGGAPLIARMHSDLESACFSDLDSACFSDLDLFSLMCKEEALHFVFVFVCEFLSLLCGCLFNGDTYYAESLTTKYVLCYLTQHERDVLKLKLHSHLASPRLSCDLGRVLRPVS